MTSGGLWHVCAGEVVAMRRHVGEVGPRQECDEGEMAREGVLRRWGWGQLRAPSSYIAAADEESGNGQQLDADAAKLPKPMPMRRCRWPALAQRIRWVFHSTSFKGTHNIPSSPSKPACGLLL